MQHNLKFILIIVFIVLSEPLYCQLDTNICYPLQIGNFWEYEGLDFTNNRVEKQYRWIPYDTILQNGERYFAIVTSHKRYPDYGNKDTVFQRTENNRYVYQYDKWCESSNYEQLFYDFGAEDSTYWDLYCDYDTYNSDFFVGVQETYHAYYDLFSFPVQIKLFTSVEIGDLWYDGVMDTTWNPTNGWGWIWMAKGIGLLHHLAELGLHWNLTGAIINHEKYGVITKVEDPTLNTTDKELSVTSYPNPFNNRTQIFIKLSSSEYVNVYLFDILGRKIKDLIINEKLNGSYTFILDSHNLSSGIYIIKVQTEKTLGSHKIIHLK